MLYYISPTESDIKHHGILGQKWGKRNGPPYPLDRSISTGSRLKKKTNNKKIEKKNKSPEDFDPFKAMEEIDDSLSDKEKFYLGVGKETKSNTGDLKFFFNKEKTAYLITADYHGQYKDEHPIEGKVIGIAAKKETRGTGATDKLISNAKREFKNEKLVAEIDKDNIASRKLFERNGFTKEMSDDYIDYYTWTNKIQHNLVTYNGYLITRSPL